MKNRRVKQAHIPGPWVIRVISIGSGNNRCLMRDSAASYVADQMKTWDAGWYGRLTAATKVFKRRGNAERWLREHPETEAVVEVDPRSQYPKFGGSSLPEARATIAKALGVK